MHILRHLTVLLLAILAMPAMKAQETIQNDPETTIGRLENGLTYYLRHNTENKGCADFYIIHNVGALQEEDNQNGLAHFLEHKLFESEEGDTFQKFAKLGASANAYTSFESTCYLFSATETMTAKSQD